MQRTLFKQIKNRFIWTKLKVTDFLIRNREFNCIHCGHCCKFIVAVKNDEIERIRSLGHKDFFFHKEDYMYIKNKNDQCMFLVVENGKPRCVIYEIRPEVCRNYPRTKTIFGLHAWDCRCHAFKVPRSIR